MRDQLRDPKLGGGEFTSARRAAADPRQFLSGPGSPQGRFGTAEDLDRLTEGLPGRPALLEPALHRAERQQRSAALDWLSCDRCLEFECVLEVGHRLVEASSSSGQLAAAARGGRGSDRVGVALPGGGQQRGGLIEVAGAGQCLDGVGRYALGVGPAAKIGKLAGERPEPGGGTGEVPEREVKGAEQPFVA